MDLASAVSQTGYLGGNALAHRRAPRYT